MLCEKELVKVMRSVSIRILAANSSGLMRWIRKRKEWWSYNLKACNVADDVVHGVYMYKTKQARV
jgi:hypothetical protein